jgi:hypothetical protein
MSRDRYSDALILTDGKHRKYRCDQEAIVIPQMIRSVWKHITPSTVRRIGPAVVIKEGEIIFS